MALGTSIDRLSRWERIGVILLFAGMIVFGCLVEYRTVFLSRHMGDLNCYLRPAWAIRTGAADIYQIRDDVGFHYNYPPFLAIMLMPLADPPPGTDHTGMVPYAISVVIWYVGSTLCLALGVHWLAGAVEEIALRKTGVPTPVGSRRWWAFRLFPVLTAIVPIGHTLMRGQVNLIVLMCFCGCIAALLRGCHARAGWWLAWPICIKVFPAFLLLYPLVRRDVRFLAGSAGGLLVGLVLIPVAVLGPARTWDYYVEFYQVTLAPGLGGGEDLSRSRELTYITATDSQSILAALHNTLYRDRDTRPPQASPTLRRVSYAIGSLLLLITLWAARRPNRTPGLDVPLFFGALILVMLFLAPVCHLHYFCMTVPLFLAFAMAVWESDPSPRTSPRLLSLMTVNILVNVLPNLPGLESLRDLAVTLYIALLVWGVAVVLLDRESRKASIAEPDPGNLDHLAA